jgi:hypothetical protein
VNVKLLQKVKQRILKSPKRFNMRYYYISTKSGPVQDMLERPSCYTQVCIAGETLLQTRDVKINRKDGGLVRFDGAEADSVFFAQTAAERLELSEAQAVRLFNLSRWMPTHLSWPERFDKAYRAAKTPQERAQVAADAIDDFIATDGWEKPSQV